MFRATSVGYRRLLSTVASPEYFPDGQSDFRDIRLSKQFYADMSGCIPKLESVGKHLIFTRPPRWGKSILQSMLFYYYDRNTTIEEFQELFGELAICKQGPTPLARSYFVLPLNLTVDSEQLKQNLFNKINERITDFAKRYDLSGVRVFTNDANASLSSLALAVKRERGNLYLLIDEYDRFANKLMFEDPEQHNNQVHKPRSSPLRSFLETVKEIEPQRTFITGITTIALADASGVNSFRNVSLHPRLSTMIGFTKETVQLGLNTLQLTKTQSNSAMDLMHDYFDGYRFPGVQDTPLFNSQQCLYFFMGLADGNFLDLLKNDQWKEMEPSELVKVVTDPNTRISDNVLGVLGNAAITRADILSLATSQVPCSVASLSTTYHLADMLVPADSASTVDSAHALMLDRSRAFMFSHGLVTLASGSQGNAGKLVVPNQVARQDYLQKLDAKLGLRPFSIDRLFQNPKPELVKDIFQSIIDKIEIAHDYHFSEGALQAIIESWLKAIQILSPHFKVHVQVTHPSPDSPDTYSDILLIDASSKVVVLIELGRIGLQYLHIGENPMFTFEELNRWGLPASEAKIDKMELGKLMALHSRSYKNRPFFTVRQHLDRKKQQVVGYESSIKKMGYVIGQNGRIDIPSSSPIYTFVVLQVGRRLVLEDVKKIGQE